MTITSKQKSAVAAVLKAIETETKSGQPVTHGTNWQRCGEALGYTGTEAEQRGREFVEALNAGTVIVKTETTNAAHGSTHNTASARQTRRGLTRKSYI